MQPIERISAATGAIFGALVVVLLAIAYDTSANVATFEGGRRHLTFGAILFFAAIGSGLGGGLGAYLGRSFRS